VEHGHRLIVVSEYHTIRIALVIIVITGAGRTRAPARVILTVAVLTVRDGFIALVTRVIIPVLAPTANVTTVRCSREITRILSEPTTIVAL
jgi:hypothetical protein